MTKPVKELDWIAMGERIKARLFRKFGWIEQDELLGVALLGIAKADKMYKHKHAGSNRRAWIYTKGFYLAVDELRRVHGALRSHETRPPKTFQGSAFRNSDGEAILFAANSCVGVPQEQYVPTSCREWLRGLSAKERRVLILRYDEGLLFEEIAQMSGTSEAGACLIARKAIERLRALRAIEFAAGERSPLSCV